MIIQIGSGATVTLDKVFGPTVFANLRITADVARGWVIERQWIKSSEYVEWCVIPAQIDAEFAQQVIKEELGK